MISIKVVETPRWHLKCRGAEFSLSYAQVAPISRAENGFAVLKLNDIVVEPSMLRPYDISGVDSHKKNGALSGRPYKHFENDFCKSGKTIQ